MNGIEKKTKNRNKLHPRRNSENCPSRQTSERSRTVLFISRVISFNGKKRIERNRGKTKDRCKLHPRRNSGDFPSRQTSERSRSVPFFRE